MSDVYRLAEPRKKGLLHLIFSRFFLIVLLLAAQILISISFYAWLRDLLPTFPVLSPCLRSAESFICSAAAWTLQPS